MSFSDALDASREEASFADGGWVGRLVDARYRIERLLGEGGMGAVFLATHIKLDKNVALKVILPQFAGDGELAERFAREAMASAKLDHPHVASALDYGTLAEGGAYLVMQFVPGRSLRAAMESGEGGWSFACAIGAQIADALAAAHAHRIVHRDLKPENVILETREEDGAEHVKVLDFGVARVVADERAPQAKQLTRVGTIIGTPGYMAPEQALGEAVDERADLYALGVVLWELCARRTLFTDDDLTVIVTKQLTEGAPLLRAISPETPAELESLVASLLARKKEDRPARAAEVREILTRLALGASYGASLPPDRVSQSLPTAMVASARAPGSGTSGQFAVSPTAVAPVVTPPPSVSATPAGSVRLAGIDVPYASLAVLVGFPAGMLALMLLLALAFGGGPSAPAPVASAPPTAPAPPATLGLPLPVMPDPPPVPEIDEALTSDIALVLEGLDEGRRAEAAERLLERPESEVPAYARAAAELETARGCRAKRDVIRAMRELADGRVRPALERVDDLPTRGCGFLNTQDCWRCLRGDLRRALRELPAD